MNTLLLPGLSGTFSNWTYFQVVFTVSDLIARVKSVDEVEIIHSGEVSKMLQRAFDPKRLQPITQYLLKQSDSYINNMTVAIFGGNPEWLNIDVRGTMFDNEMEQEMLDSIADNIGLVKLDGQETLFVLDGQHRLKALKEACKQKPEIGKEQISVTIIGHLNTDEGIKRTRRLFTTINRYAKPVSEGENILLDEDDASAILVRRLIEDYPKFTNESSGGKSKGVVAFNKTANLKSSDSDKFTTVISLWNINELILDNDLLYQYKIRKNYVRIRPDDELLDNSFEAVITFWDSFFSWFPLAAEFVSNPEGERFQNIRDGGGPFFLRPIGQEIIAYIYQYFSHEGNNEKIEAISNIPFDLKHEFWRFVLWDPYSKKMLTSKSYARNYLAYHFGIELKGSQLISLKKRYAETSGQEERTLPEPLFK